MVETGVLFRGWKYPEGLSLKCFTGGSCAQGRSGPDSVHRSIRFQYRPLSCLFHAELLLSARLQPSDNNCVLHVLAAALTLKQRRKFLVFYEQGLSSGLSYNHITHTHTRLRDLFYLLTTETLGAALMLRNVAGLHSSFWGAGAVTAALHYLQFHHRCFSEAVATHSLAAASFLSPAHYCKAQCRPVLDRGACQPGAVIIPEVTSPLSTELLRRWRQRKRLCTEAERCLSHSRLWLELIWYIKAESGCGVSDIRTV